MSAPSSRPFDHLHARLALLVLSVVALGLLGAGGWQLAHAGAHPDARMWGRRFVVLGVGLLGARLLLFPVGGGGGAWSRLPPTVRFAGGAWLVQAAAVKLFNFLSFLYVEHTERPAGPILRSWVEPLCRDWDGRWYHAIAFDGYTMGEPGAELIGNHANVAFFPLFPLLWRAAAIVIPDVCWAGWLVSNAALFGGLCGIHALTREKLGDDEASRWAVLFTLAWPFAFFFGATYTEALFLCLAVWAFWFAERGRFGWAGVLGALAAATRLTGLALLPALLLVGAARPISAREALAHIRARWPVLLVPLGTLSFFTYLAIRFGDFWANLRVAKLGWGRGLGKGGYDLFSAAAAPFQLGQFPARIILTIQLAIAFAVLPLLRPLLARAGWGYTVFVVGITAPGALSGLEGFGRYLAPAFPLAWLGAAFASKHPANGALLVLVMALFQALFLFLHTHGYWLT